MVAVAGVLGEFVLGTQYSAYRNAIENTLWLLSTGNPMAAETRWEEFLRGARLCDGNSKYRVARLTI